MKAWQLAVFCLAGLIAAGCRTDPAITQLERESRHLEDHIYDLQDDLEKTEADLQKCRRENEKLRTGYQRPSGREETPADTARPPALRGPELTPPRKVPVSPNGIDDLPVPKVEMPSKPLPEGEIPKTFLPPGPKSRQLPAAPKEGESLLEPRKLPMPGSGQTDGKGKTSQIAPLRNPDVVLTAGEALAAGADNIRVDRIALNRSLTGGWDLDGRPGDEGIVVLVEPRDAAARSVAAPAAVSVVLLDRGLPGDAARVARWDLTAGQAATLFRRTPSGDGIYLELPWPAAAPVHGHLHLFVRYTTRDGRKLEANRELDIALEGQPAHDAAEVAAVETPSQTSRPGTAWQARPAEKGSAENEPGAVSPAADSTPAPLLQEKTTPDTVPVRTATKTPRPVWSPYRR